MDGIILINKEKNMTSRDVVNIISKKYNTGKVGHGGTLDPLATGVLVIGIGKYTKVLNLLEDNTKEYIAEVLIGVATDSLDITGNEIIRVEDVKLSIEQLQRIISSYKKKYFQEIPLYSAKKINGKRLYDYARSNETIALPKKEVEIFDIKLMKFQDEKFVFYCKVSSGTYIRSLINDISNDLNIPMTMTNLKRISHGNFKLTDCHNLKDEQYNILSIRNIFNYPVIDMNQELFKKVDNGVILENIKDYERIVFTYQNKDIAIYEKVDSKLKMLLKLN